MKNILISYEKYINKLQYFYIYSDKQNSKYITKNKK